MVTDAAHSDTQRCPLGDLTAREARQRLEHEHTERLAQLTAIETSPQYTRDEVTLALLSTTRSVLAEISAALQRVKEGTYGLCQACHAPIAAERLKTLPHTQFCACCQRQQWPTLGADASVRHSW